MRRDFDIASLPNVLVEQDAGVYGSKEPLVEVTFSFTGGSETSTAASHDVVGFRFLNADRSRALQIRRNGFAFSQMTPYPSGGWASWSIEAERIWDLYAASTQPTHVSRLSVRYINRVVVPEGASAASSYFNAFPSMPESIGVVNGFMMQTEITPASVPTARLRFTQATIENPESPSGTTFLLDLEVYQTVDFKIDDPDIWGCLNQLHDIIRPSFQQVVGNRLEASFR
jgi:uncharacterized protein (TIGR04255 family)